jgi:hypothetical protein
LSAISSRDTIDLLADRSRKHIDPTGREMRISCGAALFALRLAIGEMGYLPDVQLLPDPAQTTRSPRCGAAAPITPGLGAEERAASEPSARSSTQRT